MNGQRRAPLEFVVMLWFALMVIVPFTPLRDASAAIHTALGTFVMLAVLLDLYAARHARARFRALKATTQDQLFLVHLRADDDPAGVGTLTVNSQGMRFDTGTAVAWCEWSDAAHLEVTRAFPRPLDFLTVHLTSGKRLELVVLSSWGVFRASAFKQDQFFSTVRRWRAVPDKIHP